MMLHETAPPQRRCPQSGHAGFTLIELAIVVMIIGILAVIVVPNYVGFANRAKEALVKENMHVIQTGMELYSVDHLGTYPTAADEAGLKNLLPNQTYPENPFTNLATPVAWDAEPATPGEIAIIGRPGGGYELKGHGRYGVMEMTIVNGQ